MHFDLTEDDRALAGGIRDLLAARAPDPAPLDRTVWKDLREAGVFSIAVDEDRGGLGLGATESVLVFEQLGRALVSGPLVGTFLAAGVLEGDVVGVVERVSRPTVVAHHDDLDALVAVDDEGLWHIDPRGLDGVAVTRPLDPHTPLFVPARLPQGERLGDAKAAERWRMSGTVLTAALLVGIADATAQMATAYAKQREQFGRTIGSFQAIKHLCADMHVRTEIARAATYAAGVMLDDPDAGDPAQAGAGAKLLAGRNAIANAKACIQVHGGMGFTWEVPAHLYLKRAALLETEFGSADHHAELLAAHLLEPVEPPAAETNVRT